MTLSIWRYAHLVLAVFSSLFLIIASLTGIILAVDAAGQKIPPYRMHNIESITLAKALPVLRGNYLEISEISVNHNDFVTLKGLDIDGNDVDAYINPETGEILGHPKPQSSFIQWVTALHRSLFLKETGRIAVGVVSFLLFLIAVTGVLLVIKRQKGMRRFFSKIIKDYTAQYYHVVLGRLMLIPVIIVALSGAYLTLQKFKLFHGETSINTFKTIAEETERVEAADFAIFKNTVFSDIEKIEFPFDTEDPEEFFTLKRTDAELKINQFTGAVVSEVKTPSAVLLENLNLNLHTGRTSIVWAIILAVACINILYFIYSGFAMTLKRRETRIKNKFTAQQSRFVLLAGSENGSTLRFANAIHTQLLAAGYSSYITELNNYTRYTYAEHIIIFTSTHGLGDAPVNADRFLSLLKQHQQQQQVSFSVVGFGSKSYTDFCGFAIKADELMAAQSWATRFIPLHTVDDKSSVQFTGWVKNWSAKTGIALTTTPAYYAQKPKGLKKMMVLEKTVLSETDNTFRLTLRAPVRSKYTSGDLLAIYPDGSSKERFYSIAKCNGNIQLIVKLHGKGAGSGYLHRLEPGAVIKAGIIQNKSFHFPKKAPAVAMIANGTGIAPFLGMIETNNRKTEIHLYCGFRHETTMVKGYKDFAKAEVSKGHLKSCHIAFSREQNQCYVMDLIQRDTAFFAGLLIKGGTVMICGSLGMQQDVEKILDLICTEVNGKALVAYKTNGQLLTDCY